MVTVRGGHRIGTMFGPYEVHSVIARGMAKDPAKRFASAGEFAAAANAAVTAPRPQPQQTREFPTHWPPAPAQQRRGMGSVQLVMAGAAVGLLLMAVAVSLWLMLKPNRNTAPSAPEATPLTTTTEPPSSKTSDESTATSRPSSTTSTTTSQQSVSNVPGADAQGFVNSSARCDSGNPAAAMARTDQSVLVVCQAEPGKFYYRGQRLSDGASLELANAARSPGGWDVTNPADGTRYLIRPDQLTITNGRVSEVEQMVQYASS